MAENSSYEDSDAGLENSTFDIEPLILSSMTHGCPIFFMAYG